MLTIKGSAKKVHEYISRVCAINGGSTRVVDAVFPHDSDVEVRHAKQS